MKFCNNVILLSNIFDICHSFPFLLVHSKTSLDFIVMFSKTVFRVSNFKFNILSRMCRSVFLPYCPSIRYSFLTTRHETDTGDLNLPFTGTRNAFNTTHNINNNLIFLSICCKSYIYSLQCSLCVEFRHVEEK